MFTKPASATIDDLETQVESLNNVIDENEETIARLTSERDRLRAALLSVNNDLNHMVLRTVRDNDLKHKAKNTIGKAIASLSTVA